VGKVARGIFIKKEEICIEKKKSKFRKKNVTRPTVDLKHVKDETKKKLFLTKSDIASRKM
jgi:hypothetical protein